MDEISRAIGSLDAKVDALGEKMENSHQEMNGKLDHLHVELCAKVKDHEQRIRTLEKWKYVVAGASAAIGFISEKLLGLFHRP